MTDDRKIVAIRESLVREIALHGEQTFPEECCGAILGTYLDGERFIRKLMPFPNEQEINRERRFLITPEQYREAEKLARAEKLDLLGFYHSHPDHPAVPSEFDREHAFPWFLYVIVSIMHGKSEKLMAWVLTEDRARFVEQELRAEMQSPIPHKKEHI
ncbi:MAG: M67 family metallopeptidase [Ignavibacteriae bacterium]|nr:M67 family metallopeptidase [Ignavibacteria bacterium]MBI3363578.1 M67 family metallopeptidase [Ignavibacteriota bacterium]